jgi:hypothetical protein
VRFGLTALPNAAAEAAGGLYTRGAGAGQLNQAANGQADINVARWLNTAVAAPATAGIPKVAIEAAGDFAQGAADKVWASAARTLTAFSTALALSVWDVLAAAIATANSIGLKVKNALPGANAGASGGLPTLDAGLRVKADVERWLAGLPNALIAGRVDSIASVMGVDALDSTALAASAAAEIADKLLGRNLAGGSDGTRTVQDALRILRNRRAIAAGTLTVYQENDIAAAWTAPVTTAAGNPITEIDPV